MSKGVDRRDFLKLGATLGIGASLGSMLSGCVGASPMYRVKGTGKLIKTKPIPNLRVGFVGVGERGSGLVRNLLNIDGVEIVAVCDVVADKTEKIKKWIIDKGHSEPALYIKGELDYKRLCRESDCDIVYVATPWKWHAPMAVEAMKSGKHTAVEVPAAVTLEECWQLVETSEKTNQYCIMLENCCYGREEMLVLNMVRKGLFGTLTNGAGGYLHDLRRLKFSNTGEGLWRTQHSIDRNGNLYPTHGLGPIAQMMDVNRGDQFDYMVSMSSRSVGLQEYATKHLDKDHKFNKTNFKCGDVNTSIIKTKKGLTITIVHDCNLPRPYSRIMELQGTGGLVRGWPFEIHIEGLTKPHHWQNLYDMADEHEHPLWKKMGEKAKDGGHGGMDWMMNYRLVKCLQTGEYPDMDVYDAAAWSAVSELSEKSVANRSNSVDFPDFTRGLWKRRKPLAIVGA